MKKDIRRGIFLSSTAIFCLSIFFFFRCCVTGRIAECRISPYPCGKNFAFTITDDPDGAKLERVKPIYELLDELGFKTTIACWVFKPHDVTGLPDPQDQLSSDTLEDEEYLGFLRGFQNRGFEIALHTVTAGHDKRDVTIQGYERFKKCFGDYPKINIMHSRNRENIYWGENVFRNRLMKMLVKLYSKDAYDGENINSEYFWGDICKEKSKYVRLWGTSNINTLKLNPSMPYVEVKKPFVRYWFSFSDGYNVKFFNKLLSNRNIQQLVRERGASIVYTHFSRGFTRRQKKGSYVVDRTTEEQLTQLSKMKDGWFVPASELLDRLLVMKNVDFKKEDGSLVVFNSNQCDIPGLTVVTKPGKNYYDVFGNLYTANSEGEIIIENLKAGSAFTLFEQSDNKFINGQELPFWESIRLTWERILIILFSHRG